MTGLPGQKVRTDEGCVRMKVTFYTKTSPVKRPQKGRPSDPTDVELRTTCLVSFVVTFIVYSVH